MNVLTLEQKIKIYSGGMTLMLIFVAGFIIYPSWKAVNTLQNEITNTETALEEEYKRSQELQRSLRELETVKSATEQFDASYIVPGDELSLITTLEKMAEESGITQSLSIQEGGESIQNPQMKPYTLSFTIQGDLPHILAHLRTLETAPFALRIPAIKVGKTTIRGETESTLSLSFDAYAYTESK